MNLNTQSGMIWTAVLIICYFDIPILRLGKNSAKENKKRSCLFVTMYFYRAMSLCMKRVQRREVVQPTN